MNGPFTKDSVKKVLDRYVESEVPGLQYIVVNAWENLFEYAGGRTDIRNRKAMTLDTTLMAYSMAKTFPAVAILQFIDYGKLGLDNEIDRYLPEIPTTGPTSIHFDPIFLLQQAVPVLSSIRHAICVIALGVVARL